MKFFPMYIVQAVPDRHQKLRWRMVSPARVAAALFLFICVGWYFDQTVLQILPNSGPSDFRWYYLAAQHVLHGESPFLASGYIYPPLLAFLCAPLALLDYLTARWVWFVFSHACLLGAAWLTWRRMGRDWLSACIVGIIWAGLGRAAMESLGLGQIGPQLALLVALIYCWDGWRQAACIGAGFGLKLFPGLLGLVFVLRRSWRDLLVTGIGSVLLVTAPWATVSCCLSGPDAPLDGEFAFGTPALLSWSVPSLVWRIIDPPERNGTLPNDWVHGHDLHILRLPAGKRWIPISAALATLVAGAAALAVAVGSRIAPGHGPLPAVALVTLALIASPVSWTHYQVIQYPGLALFLYQAARLQLWKLFTAGLGCAACLYPVPVEVLRIYFARNGGAWPNSPAVLYFWTSLPILAALILFALILSELKHSRWWAGEGQPACNASTA